MDAAVAERMVKLAGYVTRNGRRFEEMLLAKEAESRSGQFAFLESGHPHHETYRWAVGALERRIAREEVLSTITSALALEPRALGDFHRRLKANGQLAGLPPAADWGPGGVAGAAGPPAVGTLGSGVRAAQAPRGFGSRGGWSQQQQQQQQQQQWEQEQEVLARPPPPPPPPPRGPAGFGAVSQQAPWMGYQAAGAPPALPQGVHLGQGRPPPPALPQGVPLGQGRPPPPPPPPPPAIFGGPPQAQMFASPAQMGASPAVGMSPPGAIPAGRSPAKQEAQMPMPSTAAPASTDLGLCAPGQLADVIKVALESGAEPYQPLVLKNLPVAKSRWVEPGRLEMRVTQFYDAVRQKGTSETSGRLNTGGRASQFSRKDHESYRDREYSRGRPDTEQGRYKRPRSPEPGHFADREAGRGASEAEGRLDREEDPEGFDDPPEHVIAQLESLGSMRRDRERDRERDRDREKERDPRRAPQNEDDFGRPQKGEQMMKGMGWREDAGLGRDGTGISSALRSDGQTSRDKTGIGLRRVDDQSFDSFRKQRSRGYHRGIRDRERGRR